MLRRNDANVDPCDRDSLGGIGTLGLGTLFWLLLEFQSKWKGIGIPSVHLKTLLEFFHGLLAVIKTNYGSMIFCNILLNSVRFRQDMLGEKWSRKLPGISPAFN